MISVIIINENSDDLFKTLVSVYMQTYIEKVRLFVINFDKSLNKKTDILKKKLKVNETYVLKEESLLDKINDFINNSDSEYVFFARSGDVLFDKFAIENIYKEMGECDIFSGNNYINKVGNEYYSNNDLTDIYGLCYRISFLVKNDLYFPMILDYEKKEFNELAMYFYPIIYYSNVLIYQKNNFNSFYQQNNLEGLSNYVDRRNFFIERMFAADAPKDYIAAEIFDVFVKAYYKYSVSSEYRNIIGKLKKLNEKYERVALYLTNTDKIRILDTNRSENIPKISLDDFLKEVQHD